MSKQDKMVAHLVRDHARGTMGLPHEPHQQEEIIPMDGELHPIGTLMYDDSTQPDNSATYWVPHRTIWIVTAHRECQDFPNAPIKFRNEIALVRQEAF